MNLLEITSKQREIFVQSLNSINQLENSLSTQKEKLGALLTGLGIDVETSSVKLTEHGLEVTNTKEA